MITPEVINMKIRDKLKAKNVILASALHHGISYRKCRAEIAASIDEAWATADPAAKARQDQLFPNGKPTPEQFIVTLGALTGNGM